MNKNYKEFMDLKTLNDYLTGTPINSEKFKEVINGITDFVDEKIFKDDEMVFQLTEISKTSGRDLAIIFKNKFEIESDLELIFNNLNYCKELLERCLFQKTIFFNFMIFTEVKSMVRYYLEKSYRYDSLKNYQKLFKINSVEFHEQNEMFKYLFSIFDKLVYIISHLNEKYFKNNPIDNKELSLKFFINFGEESKNFTKSSKNFEQLNDKINQIRRSNAWHYVRKLRNNLEHDFADPSSQYNINFSILLLFIVVARCLLLINEHFQSDAEINELLSYRSKKIQK
ncbi:hypothetical protein SSABA_v1c02330 [Spiroplasma sabaudiense Ar-1343]|uniref:Uncharacterized protein n=1 Tax=Spiroplasma sabaudiense Ar-1343 TaxID=1276257 RepID=W6A9V2_9MOLU|nr:hypothetical protein [Spiroplasma sabaudiense]AHI53645.1 hypothetical protein SSABA_v1c02330 [Spiroplasma sabaudiense Ar-1343]